MRHIVLDTETTGFEAEKDDRIVEIGALELVNYVPTGRVFHHYINPQRAIPDNVIAVHGITNEQVADKPVFAEIYAEFEAFIGDDTPLVIHNAEFDMRFLNAEIKRLGFGPLPMERAMDTLAIARRLFPGASNSLDALCKRYNVDNSGRLYHGALLDSQLLAEVFLELIGGRQPDMIGGGKEEMLVQNAAGMRPDDTASAKLWPVRHFTVDDSDQSAHAEMLASIKNPIWSAEE
jgi:DNA polymerase III subunit epsilon